MAELKSMKVSPSEAKSMAEPSMVSEREYPYGLCLNLEEEALSKLGIDKLPAVDTEVMIMAKAKVCRASVRDDGNGKQRSMELQITDMALGQAVKEKSAEEVLYGE